MALSTNYGWSEPDNSSLVKNGAADIRTLGDAIDTSLWNVGFGQAGKNKIINGDFRINQRSFTSVTATSTFTFDRWKTALSGGTVTYTPQTFALGAAPVAGYEGSTFLQVVTSGQSAASDFAQVVQPIESVRTFAGQTVTFSFWAKAASGTPKIATEFSQWFGSGGSPSSQVNTYGGQVTISTSWARYSVTVAIPSISGKTLGTDNGDRLEPKFWLSAGSTFDARTGTLGVQNNTFSIWGVQVEYGSVATPFQTATGTFQGELAACQRYLPAVKGLYAPIAGYSTATNNSFVFFNYPVTPRVVPTGVTVSSASDFQILNGAGVPGTPVSFTFDSFNTGINAAGITVVSTVGSPTLVSGQGAYVRIVSSSGSILFTGCEL